MANTILTPTVILREAGRLFHQKARFIGSIDRQYDSRFAQTGAKVGDTIALRDPVQFTVSDGAKMIVQDVSETSQNLTVATRKHIAFKFSSQDLTLKIDDFSARYLEKGIARLAAEVESLVIAGCRKRIPNFVDGNGAAFSFDYAAKAKQKLDEHLAPEDGNRYMLLNPTHNRKYVVEQKGLFVPGSPIAKQYQSGNMQDALGFNTMGTTFLPNLTTGTAGEGDSGYDVNGASEGADGLVTLKTGTATFKEGEIVTFAGCNDVHPETKSDLGYLKQFVVTADFAGGAGDLHISPSIVTSGAYQNVTAYPTDSGQVTKVGGGNGDTLVESLAYHSDAFVFATADLYDPSREGKWAAREVMDGISMRIWRDSDIWNDEHPCRIDVLFGYLARYAEKLAVRIHADA